MNAKVKLVTGDLNDDWYYRLMAKVKGVAVGNGQLAVLPWESAL